jgi:sugar-specific transcriptional regulator TrmB
MTIKNTLEQLGLTGKRSDIYLACLELGSATIIDIAKKAKVKRTTCYDIVLDLQSDVLISKTLKGKKTLFVAEDPAKMVASLKNKERILAEILPELQSIYNIKGTKPKIRFYEGKEGLKEVYDDTLRYPGEIVGFAGDDVVKILGTDWANDYLARRVKKGIGYRALLPGSDTIIKDFVSHNKEQLRQVKLVSHKRYPFSIEINLYGKQRIALMSAKEEIALIIEGVEIHNTLKAIFDLIWDLLPEMKS